MSYVAVVIIYNMVRFAVWALSAIATFLVYAYHQWKQRQALKAGTTVIEIEQTSNEL